MSDGDESERERLSDRVQAAWVRSESWRGPVMLVAGFGWDAATLRRIDQLQDNLLLLGYLLLLAVLVVIEQRIVRGAWVPALLGRFREGVHLGAQFLFGGLFSAYIVFYSRSATVGRGLLFLAMLAVLLVVNELAERRLRAGGIRVTLFGLCAFSFLLFFLPVITGKLLGLLPATLGALLATAAVVGCVNARVVSRDPEVGRVGQSARSAWLEALGRPLGGVAFVLGIVGVLRWMGFVPPVPLALEHVGIFHDVERTDEGYQLTWERQGWFGLRRHDAVFRWEEGEKVWCFTAVFAPTGMELDVVHRWWFYDPDDGWIDTNAIDFDVTGGREGGFRGYTWKEHLRPGDWAVTVETPDGGVLGEVRFELRAEEERGELVTRSY